MSIASARLGEPLWAPTDALRKAGFVTSLFQGCAYAVDPRTKTGYLFQLQAVRTGPGDVEDLRIHRFAVTTTNRGVPMSVPLLVYRDTMTIVRGGHVQSAHVRISAAGNPYLWLGLERYDQDNRQTGADLYRVRYSRDVKAKDGTWVTTDRKASTVQRIYTGDGTVTAIGCPDWTIVLRRPDSEHDVFEWHSEKDLVQVQPNLKGKTRLYPRASVVVPKSTNSDSYQSAVAQGRYADPTRIFRVTGASSVLISDSGYRGSTELGDLTERILHLLGVDHVEPEGLITIDHKLHVAVQTGSIAQRRVAYIPLTW